MLAQMTEGMINFAEQYGIAIQDPMLIRRYRIMYQDARRDEATRIAVAEQKARADEREKAKENMAKGMKMKKYPVSDIAEITGLSVSEIDAL